MTRSAERALARKVGPFIGRETNAREQRIEGLRKAALRASWLDMRQPAALKAKSTAFDRYHRALRSHLKLDHLYPPVNLPDDLGLDALHEELHGRT